MQWRDYTTPRGSHLHQEGSQKRSSGPHGRLVPVGLARPPTPVSKNRLKCGAVTTASCLPPSLKIRIVVAHERTVLPSMPLSLMLPGPKSLKTVIVEAYVTLLEAHESSAATRSSFGCILHLPPRSASSSVIPLNKPPAATTVPQLRGRIFWTTDSYGPEKRRAARSCALSEHTHPARA